MDYNLLREAQTQRNGRAREQQQEAKEEIFLFFGVLKVSAMLSIYRLKDAIGFVFLMLMVTLYTNASLLVQYDRLIKYATS